MRIRDYGITVGSLPTGKLNKITDIPGVAVGHATITDEKHNTGVTVIMPCPDNPFLSKLPCASFVLNGYGKTQGLVQVDELGTLETPIALTSTLNVGLVHDAMVGYMIKRCADDGCRLMSVNPVVCECNDGFLNDASDRPVRAEHFEAAAASASADFEEGAVGGGRGMSCHGLKGGIGSSSRIVEFGGRKYTIGVLTQSNYGRLGDLRINGVDIGRRIIEYRKSTAHDDPPDKGSCIMVLATDLPLSDRQLRRTAKRCAVGLARLGSYIGNGSGDVFVAFSTANRRPAGKEVGAIYGGELFSEDCMDTCFRAAAECAEEAVLNSMTAAEAVTSGSGNHRNSLNEYMFLYGKGDS